jgi:hypothetical protein
MKTIPVAVCGGAALLASLVPHTVLTSDCECRTNGKLEIPPAQKKNFRSAMCVPRVTGWPLLLYFNPSGPSGNYMYHLLWQSVTLHFVRYEVLTASRMRMTVFRDIALCSLAGVDRRFGRLYSSLMLDAVRTTETSVYSSEPTRRYFPEDSHLLTLHFLFMCFVWFSL